MKNLFTLITLAFAMLFTQGCLESVAVQEYSESKNSASVDLNITDITTSAVIDSALVSWYVDGVHTIEYTDSTGRLTIPSLKAGVYNFTIEKAGYAAMVFSANLSSVGETEMPVIADIDRTIQMHALSVSITGVVKLQDPDNNKTVKSGVVVDLLLVDTLQPEGQGYKSTSYSTVTDSTGSYTFTGLPERVDNYDISTRRLETDGFNYRPILLPQQQDLKPNEVISMEPAILIIDAPDLIVDSWVQDIGTTDTLTIAFSDTINLEKIKLNNIAVTNGANDQIATNYTFYDGNSKLKVFPAMGNWGTIGTYSISLTLTSIHGDNINMLQKSFSVINTDLPGDVTGLVADFGSDTTTNYNDSIVFIKWNEIPNVSGYEVYKKRTGDDNFIYVSSYDNEITNATIPNLDFENAAATELMIVSYNHNNTSNFATAPIITFRDVVVPKMNHSPGSTINSNNLYMDNTLYAIKDSIGNGKSSDVDGVSHNGVPWTLIGDADIDTTAVVTATFKLNPTVLGVDWAWNKNSNGDIVMEAWITVPPATDASGINLDTLVIQGLKDVTGNVRTTPVQIRVEF